MRRQVVFWRHGRTQWNADKRFQGQTDIPLDPVGIEQANRAAAVLAELAPARIVSSDLGRARSTAQALADLTGLPVALDEGLRETSAGTWEGLTRREIDERFTGQMDLWSVDPDLRPGGGESRREVAVRVVAAVERALSEVPAAGTLVVATHGGAARAGIGALLGLPPEHWAVLGVLTNCAWSVLVEGTESTGPRWRLVEYNAKSLPAAALADDR